MRPDKCSLYFGPSSRSPALPPLDICNVIAATAELIMHWLREACRSRFQCYFHVAAHFLVCLFFSPLCGTNTDRTAVYLLLPGSLGPAGMMIASPSLFRRIKNIERQRQLRCRQYEARLSFPRFSSMQIHRCGSESRPRSTVLG